MTFRENINRICKQRGVSLSRVVMAVTGSSALVTSINKGHLPKEEIMIGLARQLDCNIMDFFSDELHPHKLEDFVTNEELDLITIFRSLPRSKQYEILSVVTKYAE